MTTTRAHRRQLDELVAGRLGWAIAEPKDDDPYAWRTVEIIDVSFHLFVMRDSVPHVDPRMGWVASFRSIGGSVSGSWGGTFDQVLAEVAQVERCLDTVNRLRECRSRLATTDLLDSLKGADLRFVAELVGLPRSGTLSDLRQRIVERTCGTRIDADAMMPKNGRW